MLRLSKLTDYGTVLMTRMARESGRIHTAAELAAALGLGTATVSKLLKLLAGAGLLVSHRGAKGGYTLSRRPDEISVADVIHALEGPIAFTECSGATGTCVQEATCSIRGNWRLINEAVRQALEGVTLAQMARPAPRSAAAQKKGTETGMPAWPFSG
jgi:FeS assembly SUF system regulator